MEKRIRFGDLVRNSGRPRVVTLWTAPQKDRTVSRAVKENRVLTVMEPPHKTRFGVRALKEDPHAIYLVFPRPLDLDPGARVVGINYQLAEQPELTAPADPAPAKPGPRGAPSKPQLRPQSKPKSKLSCPRPAPAKRFKVHVRRTATLEETRAVEAANRREAKLRAMNAAKGEPFDLNRAVVRDVVKVE